MDEMTQQNAALVEESSAASRSMSEEAKSMNELISFFRIEKGHEISESIQGHTSQKPQLSLAHNADNLNLGNLNKDKWDEF